KATSREQKITITASSGLSKEEVDRMVKDAQRFSDEDKKRKEEVEVRNNADSAVYQSEKMLKDLGDKVPADVRGEIEPKIATLKTAMGGRDVTDIKTKTDELMQSMQKIGERMYQQAGATPPPGQDGGGETGAGGGPQGPGGGSDTVEGEFREVKD
ncbi:MAG: Hsp70 family protein, partial [Chloroflexi bacterium]|nr:Hsp70 family protein [Chloroflexota bacterium]